jgi:purine-binding chemotaxis protein CheW
MVAVGLEGEAMLQTTVNSRATSGEYVVFRMGGQEYCIDVLSVREIRGWTPTTPLPRSPEFVRGVVNLRGTVLPILDLAARLGFETSEAGARHAIMVTQVRDKIVGLLVEGVSDILSIDADTIQTTPEIADHASRACIRGIVPIEGRMIGVLALETVIPAMEPLAA